MQEMRFVISPVSGFSGILMHAAKVASFPARMRVFSASVTDKSGCVFCDANLEVYTVHVSFVRQLHCDKQEDQERPCGGHD